MFIPKTKLMHCTMLLTQTSECRLATACLPACQPACRPACLLAWLRAFLLAWHPLDPNPHTCLVVDNCLPNLGYQGVLTFNRCVLTFALPPNLQVRPSSARWILTATGATATSRAVLPPRASWRF